MQKVGVAVEEPSAYEVPNLIKGAASKSVSPSPGGRHDLYYQDR